MNFTRRLFLGGLATAFAATKVPMSDRAFGFVPILWGNGVDDDAPALNAWVRGDPVRIGPRVTAAVVGETYAIKGATLMLGSGWSLAEADFYVKDCTFSVLPQMRDSFLISVPNKGRAYLENIHMDLSGFHPNAPLEALPCALSFRA